jgi:glycosyltransferase involved in cell wall biosynthesis
MEDTVAAESTATAAPATGGVCQDGAVSGSLVMLCDVDFDFVDATRTHTVEVARGFALAGLDVDLVARGPDQQIEGVRYSAARGDEHQRLLRFVTINFQTIRLLWRRRGTTSRFYVREKWTCIPSMAVARLLGYRIVTEVDGIHFGPGIPAIRGFVKRLAAVAMGRLSHGVLAVTPEIEQLLVGSAMVPRERIAVIGNGVDIEFFRPTSRLEALERCNLDPGFHYVIFCGGFHPWTDFDLMLDAFSVVAAEQTDARLLLVGDGPERQRIVRRTENLSLGSKVIMTGLIHERTRVRDYLGAATAALLLYRTDVVTRTSASPVKLNEYLASGRAVVAAEIPGVRALVEDPGAGIIVDGSVSAVAEAVLELLRDPERADAMGVSGRRFAEERLSWRVVVRRTLPLFGIV